MGTSQEVLLEAIPDYNIVSGKGLLTWPVGTVFEQGMAAYFYAADPEVNVTPTLKITGMESGATKGTIVSHVMIQALNDKSEIYWTYQISQTPLQEFVLSKATDNNQAAFIAPVIPIKVTSAYNLVTQIGKELMFQTGIFQLVVTSEINLHGLVNDEPVDKNIVLELPLTLQQVSFTIPKTQDAMSQTALQKNNTQASPNYLWNTIRSNLIPFIADLLLVLLLLVLIFKSGTSGSKSEAEHRRYKEWITEGSVEIKDRFSIHILNLEGLVDLAIDLDKRVIFDARLNKYYVLTEDIVYIYDPERSHSMLENKTQLGKLLLDRGLLAPEQLEIGLYYQKKIGSRLGESLIALGFIDETTLYSTLADQQQMDYYELDPKYDITDLSWLDKMSIQKARALMSLPLGVSTEGKLVIACSETSREGIKTALQEMFDTEVYLIAARPSAIYEMLKQVEEQEKDKLNSTSITREAVKTASERLTGDEKEQFIASYYRGMIRHDLMIKASGLTEPVNSEITNLMKGLGKAVETMDFRLRKEKQMPELIDLLFYAHYLTAATMEWIMRELALQGISLKLLLRMNYLVSEETLKKAAFLIDTLENVLK